MVFHEQEGFYTAEDLLEISNRLENEGKAFDLIEGILYEMVTGGEHGEVLHYFELMIGNHVLQNKLGRMTGAETGYLLYKDPDPKGKDTVLGPDIGFITLARAPQRLPSGLIPYAPDLAVEVVSPGNTSEEIELKIENYIRYGTRLVWIAYPTKIKLRVCRPNPNEPGGFAGKYLNANDILDGEDVLPGFQIKVSDIFKDPLED